MKPNNIEWAKRLEDAGVHVVYRHRWAKNPYQNHAGW